MKPTQRLFTAALVVNLALALSAAWGYYRWTHTHGAAQSAVEETRTCRGLAAQIRALDSRPTQADSQEMPIQDLTRRIEQSAADAGIPMASLVRISPQPASRIGDTPYKTKSTQVLLQRVSLRQVILFHHALETQGVGLLATGLRLAAPQPSNANGLWTSESTLTHVVYSPTTPNPRRDQG